MPYPYGVNQTLYIFFQNCDFDLFQEPVMYVKMFGGFSWLTIEEMSSF